MISVRLHAATAPLASRHPQPATRFVQLLGAVCLTAVLASSPTGVLAQAAPAASAPKAGASAPKAPSAPAKPTIKRWVDERGTVHFSDAPPPASARVASPVTELSTAPPLSADEQAKARELMQQYRGQLATAPEAPASAASGPRRAAAAPANQSCAAQWQRYGEAYRCLDRFRAAKGVVRPEAFAQCPVIAQPDCPAPASP